MFIFVPIRVEEATVDRLPWVSIGIAALCAVLFAVTWVAPKNRDGFEENDFNGVLRYWEQHPYLELSPQFLQYLTPRGHRSITQQRERALEQQVPDAETLEQQQATLRQLEEVFLDGPRRSLLRRFSLIPERGLFQPGWLTHMFLHFGWLHILGNLFFFYLVGPMLEDVWGRPLFAGFFLLGGFFGGVAHFLLDPSSYAMMAGASGAIAACIGAFTLRYANRKIRFGYFVFLVTRMRRGTVLVPAWAWGLFWIALELWSFAQTGGHSGVAVMAHIGGFGFGVALAAGMRATGLEAKYLAPVLEKKTGGWSVHPAVTEATEAMERGDPEAAARAYARALAEQPDNREAQLGLARLELDGGRAAEGMARVSRVLEKQLAENDGSVWTLLEELGPRLEPERLRPALAYRLATAMEDSGPEGVRPRALPFYLAAGAAGGALGAKALLRAAQLRLDSLDQPQPLEARAHVARALAFNDVPEELRAQLSEVATRAEGLVTARPRGSLEALEAENAEALAAHQASLAAQGPRVIPCQLLAMGTGALTLRSEAGNETQVSFGKILGVAVGTAPAPAPEGTPPRRLLLTDLVMSWGEEGRGPTVLRLPAGALGLGTVFPGVPPREAYARFLSHVLAQSGATALPDAQAIRQGQYPSFPDEQAMTQALYGQG
ncbi:MAG TPA: rhomboid family intramembrane serine protease [Myxococcaceae bacterium]|nr:rhomboid family intramembrane serine protease [Myxococcaceae bacterium]